MSYSLAEVSAMLGLPAARIRAWSNSGLVEPGRDERGELRFEFHDLILLRTAGELTAANVPQRRLQRAVAKLREQLPSGRALTGVRISADGERVVVRDGDAVWNPESGQSLFDFSVAEIAAKTVPLLQEAQEHAESSEDWFALACELEVTSLEKARAAYERVLQENPDHAGAHVNLGRLLHEDGRANLAARHYRAALEVVPDHETASFNLGVALEDLGRFDDAINAYERAITIDPSNADAHYNLAGLHERRGDKQTALQYLKSYKALVG